MMTELPSDSAENTIFSFQIVLVFTFGSFGIVSQKRHAFSELKNSLKLYCNNSVEDAIYKYTNY